MNLSLFGIHNGLFQELVIWLVPVGTGHDWWGAETNIPKGYVLADGTTYPIAKYPRLGKLFGSTYGGDGVTTFAVPDKRGRTSVGKDNMGGTAQNRITSGNSGVTGTTLGAVGGSELLHQHSHANTFNDANHSHGQNCSTGNDAQSASFRGTLGGANNSPSGGVGDITRLTTDVSTTGASITNVNAGTGSSQNVQPSIVCNYIIRVG